VNHESVSIIIIINTKRKVALLFFFISLETVLTGYFRERESKVGDGGVFGKEDDFVVWSEVDCSWKKGIDPTIALIYKPLHEHSLDSVHWAPEKKQKGTIE
jgi:hypothetical protein